MKLQTREVNQNTKSNYNKKIVSQEKQFNDLATKLTKHQQTN